MRDKWYYSTMRKQGVISTIYYGILSTCAGALHTNYSVLDAKLLINCDQREYMSNLNNCKTEGKQVSTIP
jgi:hypothetical protein